MVRQALRPPVDDCAATTPHFFLIFGVAVQKLDHLDKFQKFRQGLI
jgi:hypothetical protein